MKEKRVSKKQLILGTASFLMVLFGTISYVENKAETPIKIESVIDGDTLVLSDGNTVKLFGVNTYENGSESSLLAKQYLATLLDGRNVWIEYENKMAKVWVGCEATPKFLMSKLRGFKNNPIGCAKGTMANDQILKMGWSK